MERRRKKSQVTCSACGKSFMKEDYEIERSRNKHGDRHYCNLKCVALKAKLVQYGDTLGFGHYLSESKKSAKAKNLDHDITKEYLRDVFKMQDGRCALSGLSMTFIRMGGRKHPRTLKSASLDRIDNSKGYVVGNVQFVCLGINYMRNRFSIGDAVEFLNELKSSKVV